MGPFWVGQIPANPHVFTILDSQDNLADLSSYETIKVLLTDPLENINDNPGTVDPYSPANPGKIILHWNDTTSQFTMFGTWLAQLKMEGPGNILDYTSAEPFEVNATPPASAATESWASSSDVTQITNKTVDIDQILAAQAIIEIVTNRTYAATTHLRARDKVWLKRAVAYQSVWQTEQPDIFTRAKLTSIAQDGTTAVLSEKAAVYMAPLAIRALRNVSFMRSRSLRMQTPFIDRRSETTNPLIDDTVLDWQPM